MSVIALIQIIISLGKCWILSNKDKLLNQDVPKSAYAFCVFDALLGLACGIIIWYLL